jgi:hypothetical protein
MADELNTGRGVEQFLLDRIDTVPHLEALLLLWGSRPKPWSVEDMAKGLFVEIGFAHEILDGLANQGLITASSGPPPKYHYESHSDLDQIIASVESTYRRELIRISRMIHSKAPAAVREFARAFRLKKDKH